MLNPSECAICRLELSDRLLDNRPDNLVESVYAFVAAFQTVADSFGFTLYDAVETVINELHEEHHA
jgi:hypothetical protein